MMMLKNPIEPVLSEYECSMGNPILSVDSKLVILFPLSEAEIRKWGSIQFY